MKTTTSSPTIQFGQDGRRHVTILCCLCSSSFSPSITGTNICLNCISSQVDITTGITRESILDYCKNCDRYLGPPWTSAELESQELLDICLKNIRGLNQVKVVDANFVSTEPRSKRVKVKLTVQKEGIQQSFFVEFTVNCAQCDDCKKEFALHKWGAVVQVRQRVDHRKTFQALEQLISKHSVHEAIIKVEDVSGGIDFFFNERKHAQKLVDFLRSMLPVRIKTSKQLISHNGRNHTDNYRFTFSVEVPQICKDDLVVLKPELANSLGRCTRLLLCTKVASGIHFVDVINMKIVEMSSAIYFQHEEGIVIIPAEGNLAEFMVIDVEPPESKSQSKSLVNSKFKASLATVGRITDWRNFQVRTHMGNVIDQGSSVMGYDLSLLSLTGNDEIAAIGSLPDVILARMKVQDENSIDRKKQVEGLLTENNQLKNSMKNLKDTDGEAGRLVDRQKGQISGLMNDVEKLNKEIKELKQREKDRLAEEKKRKMEVNTKRLETGMEDKSAESGNLNVEKERRLVELEEMNKTFTVLIQGFKTTMLEVQEKMEKNGKYIAEMQKKLDEKNAEIESLKNRDGERDSQTSPAKPRFKITHEKVNIISKGQIKQYEKEIAEKDTEINVLKEMLKSCKEFIRTKELEIQHLKQKNNPEPVQPTQGPPVKFPRLSSKNYFQREKPKMINAKLPETSVPDLDINYSVNRLIRKPPVGKDHNDKAPQESPRDINFSELVKGQKHEMILKGRVRQRKNQASISDPLAVQINEDKIAA